MPFRLTIQTLLILQALLEDPARELYGLELSVQTGLLPGTAYPILWRLENAGWVMSRAEDMDPHAEKRRARRYYRLTDAGATQAREAITGARRPSSTALRTLSKQGKRPRARQAER